MGKPSTNPTPSLTLRAITAEHYVAPARPLDELDIAEAACIVSEFLHERPAVVAQLPATERAAVEQLWQAEGAWQGRWPPVDAAGKILPAFKAQLDAHEAFGDLIRATFRERPADADGGAR